MGDITKLKSPEEKIRELSCREIQPFLEDLLEKCKANLLNEVTMLVEDSEGGVVTICGGNSVNSFRSLYLIQTSLYSDYLERNIHGDWEDDYEAE